jgi:hypothetical protein
MLTKASQHEKPLACRSPLYLRTLLLNVFLSICDTICEKMFVPFIDICRSGLWIGLVVFQLQDTAFRSIYFGQVCI